MMNIPNDLKYTKSHEWVRVETDGSLTLGITDVAQDMLGDLVFVGDAKVGEKLKAGDAACVVESVKAASDVYIPVDGEITAFNDALDAAPETLNKDPYGSWILKIKPAAGANMGALLDAAGYKAAVDAAQ
jgi:glycine cleavage system H protein